MIKFKGLVIRKSLNGCGYDKQERNGDWSVYFTSSLNNAERDQLALLLK